jgi:hypothetical protein
LKNKRVILKNVENLDKIYLKKYAILIINKIRVSIPFYINLLKFIQKKNRWLGKAQSGFYIDFFLKKLAEIFIRNIFVFAALFFGEKYMIEHLTKKTVDSFIYNSNKFVG